MTLYVARAISNNFISAGTRHLVRTIAGHIYVIFADEQNDVVFSKSTDDGDTWSAPVVIRAGTTSGLAIWYDRWSGIAAGLIHCAITDTGTDNTNYVSIDTENSDAISSVTAIFSGVSAVGGGALSITRARGGNLYCKTMIDAGAEGGFFRSTDVGASWTSRTDAEALAVSDQWALMPGFAADNQDIMAVFLDASASEISRYIYDDSSDSWAETSISTGITPLVSNTGFPNWSVAVDLTNSQVLLAVWNSADAANADLLFFAISEGSITAAADVVTNSTGNQGLCGISIDTATDDLYVFYSGRSGGGDIFPTHTSVFYKKSTDAAASWGSETFLSPGLIGQINAIFVAPRFDTQIVVCTMSAVAQVVVPQAQPAAGGLSTPLFGNGVVS